MTTENILETLQQLLKIPSVVRYEQPLLYFLQDYCERFNDYEIKQTDRLLIVKKKNTPSQKIISAHIDRHGFVTREDGKIVYAAFEAKDYYEQDIEAEERVFEKVASRFMGESVYAYDPVSGEELARGKIIGTRYDFENKYVEIELNTTRQVRAGTPFALVSTVSYQKDYFQSQIDNSISVAVVLQLLEDGFDGTVIFTTEEEIGMSWKHLADYLQECCSTTKELIVLDTSPYLDMNSIDEGLVVLRARDETGIFNKELVNTIREICVQENIPYEFKDNVIEEINKEREQNDEESKSYGHTELGRLVEHTKAQLNGATIQLPSTNYHTNEELSSKKALENYYLLLKKLLF